MPMTIEMQDKKPKEEKPLQLDAGTASRVRRGFGIDPARLQFSESEAVRAMGARAVTKGNVISFAPGEFSPRTPEGLSMLGHELAHARSQAKGETPMTGGVLEQPGYEDAADQAGEAFASGSLTASGPVSPTASAAAPAQMWPWSKKKKKPKQTAAEMVNNLNIQSRVGEVKPFVPFSPEETEGINASTVRGSSNYMDNGQLKKVDHAAHFMPTLGAYYQEVGDLYREAGQSGLNMNVDNAEEIFVGSGMMKVNPEAAAMAQRKVQMLLQYVEQPEFQNYLRGYFQFTGGGDYKAATSTIANADIISNIISCLWTRGLAAMEAGKQLTDPKQREFAMKGVDGILSKAEMIRNDVGKMDSMSEDRKAAYGKVLPMLTSFLESYEALRQKIVEISITAMPASMVDRLSPEDRETYDAQKNKETPEAPPTTPTTTPAPTTTEDEDALYGPSGTGPELPKTLPKPLQKPPVPTTTPTTTEDEDAMYGPSGTGPELPKTLPRPLQKPPVPTTAPAPIGMKKLDYSGHPMFPAYKSAMARGDLTTARYLMSGMRATGSSSGKAAPQTLSSGITESSTPKVETTTPMPAPISMGVTELSTHREETTTPIPAPTPAPAPETAPKLVAPKKKKRSRGFTGWLNRVTGVSEQVAGEEGDRTDTRKSSIYGHKESEFFEREPIAIESASGNIRGSRFKPKKVDANGKKVVLYSGSGGSGKMLESVVEEYTKFGYTVYLMDYRGFGRSDRLKTHHINQETIYEDGEAIYNFAKDDSTDNVDAQSPITVHGFSLGGAVASHVAQQHAKDKRGEGEENQIEQLVMHSAMDSTYKQGKKGIGMGPIGWLGGKIAKSAFGNMNSKKNLKGLLAERPGMKVTFMGGDQKDHLSPQNTGLLKSARKAAGQNNNIKLSQGGGKHVVNFTPGTEADGVKAPFGHLSADFLKHVMGIELNNRGGQG